MPSDLFKRKHSEFLHCIERVWSRYIAETHELQIFLQTSRQLPPSWINGYLKVSACNTDGCRLTELPISWSYVSGSPKAGSCPCPSELAPKPESPFIANIGDFVLYAGDCERSLPSQDSRDPLDLRDDVRLWFS